MWRKSGEVTGLEVSQALAQRESWQEGCECGMPEAKVAQVGQGLECAVGNGWLRWHGGLDLWK